jgi:ubiquinone/menaquinone biosynthesis C-methylase UbiE
LQQRKQENKMLEKTDKLLFFYENLVNWKSRLAKEGTFITELFKSHNVHNILDCGCGIGKHVFFLRQNGFNAHGSDLNPLHIEKAKQLADNEPGEISFFHEDMTELPMQQDESWDGVMSLGNTLSAIGHEKVEKAFKAFCRVLKPGGIFIVQILNFAFLKVGDRTEVRSAMIKGQEVVYVKTFHCESDHYLVLTNVLSRSAQADASPESPDKKWDCMVESTKMHNLTTEFISSALEKAGFKSIKFFGSLNGEDYDKKNSRDLVFTAIAP